MWTTVKPGIVRRPCGGGGPVKGGRAEAAAEHQHDAPAGREVELAPALLGGRVEHRPRHRPARELVARRVEAGDRERQEHPPRERGRQAVGEAEVGIDLHQRRRDPQRRRGGQHRPGDVPAAAEHDVGPHPAQDARARRGRERGQAEPAREPQRRPPRQAGHAVGVQRIAGRRNESRLDPLGRAGEDHVGAPSRELGGHRQSRDDVSGGSAGCDQHSRAAAGIGGGWRWCHRQARPCGRVPAGRRRRSGACRSR